MPTESLNFKKNSPDLKKFVEQGWNNVSSFQEFEAELDAKRRTPPSNPGFSRFVSRSASMKKRKPAPIFTSPNNSSTINRSGGRRSLEDREQFVIEDVSSDDEPKVKKIGLCTEKGNQIMVNLSRRKKRGSVSDPNSSKQSRSSTNSSLNGSYSFTRNSSSSNRSASSEEKSPHKKASTTKVSESKPAIETKVPLSQSISDCTTPTSVPKPIQLAKSFGSRQAINTPSLLSRRKLNLVAHSTPKGTSKPLKKLDQMVKDCSPLRRIENVENAGVDLKDSKKKDSMPNGKTTKDDRPKSTNHRSKARTLFNSTNSEFNADFHTPGSPVRQPLSQTISDPESPVVQNKSRSVNLAISHSTNKRFQQVNQFKTPIKQRPVNICTSLVPFADPPMEPVELVASQRISQCDSPMKNAPEKVTESRCFLKLSKKMEKLLTNHRLGQMNESKRVELQKQPLLYDLLDSIHQRMEAQKAWLSANKQDDTERESLFLKLTRVAEPRNGFVDCDCVIDTSRMQKVILFKYPQLKTMIPVHYANHFEISCGALLEYISPWCTFDCDKLRITFVENPFWVNIHDHGRQKLVADKYEVVYTNPDLNVDRNMLLALTE